MRGSEMRASSSEELFNVQLKRLHKTEKAQTKRDTKILLEHARNVRFARYNKKMPAF